MGKISSSLLITDDSKLNIKVDTYLAYVSKVSVVMLQKVESSIIELCEIKAIVDFVYYTVLHYIIVL